MSKVCGNCKTAEAFNATHVKCTNGGCKSCGCLKAKTSGGCKQWSGEDRQ